MASVTSPKIFRRPALNLGRQGEGIRSLPDLLQFNAQHNKDHVFCLQASVDRGHGSHERHGPRDYVTRPVTMSQLHGAVLACAAWMKRELPPHDPETEPDARSVALFMESDVGLFVCLAAALYLGVPVSIAIPPELRVVTKGADQGPGDTPLRATGRLQRPALDGGNTVSSGACIQAVPNNARGKAPNVNQNHRRPGL